MGVARGKGESFFQKVSLFPLQHIHLQHITNPSRTRARARTFTVKSRKSRHNGKGRIMEVVNIQQLTKIAKSEKCLPESIWRASVGSSGISGCFYFGPRVMQSFQARSPHVVRRSTGLGKGSVATRGIGGCVYCWLAEFREMTNSECGMMNIRFLTHSSFITHRSSLKTSSSPTSKPTRYSLLQIKIDMPDYEMYNGALYNKFTKRLRRLV